MVVITSFPPPTEGIRHREPNTIAHIKSRDLGKGTLYIAESRLSWVGENGQGFSLEYPSICLHAVSRDLNAFPCECLYLMIDAELESNGEEQNGESQEDEESKTSEVRFVPENTGVLDAMFKAMMDCQALHPDPDDSYSDDEVGCFEDAEDDSGAEYDVAAAERGCGHVDAPRDDFCGDECEEPMDVAQFEDADAEH
ncbi:methylosome subunit pICln-like [Limulus polyphemus]|uniref:Methylosome subunit pICln n=1 Tax=Limulus polyphemus TaxID=6850 RepID=A0ABM1SFQ3_LIMPO|nr:methylosome subunit pICln-like [Limulus polyphemus]XP_022242458.1 methylosome subunit pICln-like [Limulus polyphemus]